MTGYYYTVKGPSKYRTLSTIPKAVIRVFERALHSSELRRPCRMAPALALAVRACVDSYWKDRRSPESVQALLLAGATVGGVDYPSGYAEVDSLLAAAVSVRAQPG